jgi:hypothetical protein
MTIRRIISFDENAHTTRLPRRDGSRDRVERDRPAEPLLQFQPIIQRFLFRLFYMTNVGRSVAQDWCDPTGGVSYEKTE